MNTKILIIAILTLGLISCGDNSAPDSQQPAQSEDKAAVVTTAEKTAPKQVVASFYPLAFIAEQIVGENANVTNMAGSVDVHLYEPLPQDLVKMNKADLVVYLGAELEPWTDTVIPELQAKGVTAFEASHDLDLFKLEEHKEHHDEHKGHHDEHEAKHDQHEEKHDGHKEHHDEHAGHDEHNHGEFDPHIWLDPVLAQQISNKLLETIVQVDAANEAVYRANADALNQRFAQLDQDYQAGLSPKDEPSAKILAELQQKAKQGITHILIEENKVRSFAEMLARETGLQTLAINPLGRGTLDPAKDYFDIMQENLNSLKVSLNCQ